MLSKIATEFLVFAFQQHRRPGPASLNLSAHSPFSSTGIPACAPSNTQQQTKMLGAPRDGVLASCLLHPNTNATSATAVSPVGAPSASRLPRRGAAQFSPGRKAWEKINAQTRHRSRRLSRDPLQNVPSPRNIAKNAKVEIQARFDRLEYPVTASTAAPTITYSRTDTHR